MIWRKYATDRTQPGGARAVEGADAGLEGTRTAAVCLVGTVCNVYEDDNGPICYVRGSKALRLELHFADNYDAERNTDALRNGVATFSEQSVIRSG